ncbi:hypothetical protein PPACK8108_LOCUS22074 [Phakopsora pachyrhizi]|uniref:Metallothionein n=1 Tax=Phakopsora pachyrhizi TaxID=170000 RepID=A0AAV0BJC6_PHAPC|nr:hypothetical protein PPACK8108_LOCUS22074 [Phakopsora pachyrhizi]
MNFLTGGCPDFALEDGSIRSCTCQPCCAGNLNECSCNKSTGCACTSSVLPADSPNKCICAASNKPCDCASCPCSSAVKSSCCS